jgi:hypothetical protein
MTNVRDVDDITLPESDTAPGDTREYEFSMTASAIVTGPVGTIRITRRYHALLRHNDVLVEGPTDSNDELLTWADQLHVHSKYYERAQSGDDYFLDRHETWRPTDSSVFTSERAFFEVCEAHHLTDIVTEYTAVMGDRERKRAMSR